MRHCWNRLALVGLLAGGCTGAIGGHDKSGTAGVPGVGTGGTGNGNGGLAGAVGAAGATASGAAGVSGGVVTGAGGATGNVSCTPAAAAAPAAVALRRLTQAEYNATVATLFPGVALPAIDLPEQIDASGFENRASLQNPTALLVEQASTGAAKIAEAAAKNLTALVPCAATDATCGAQFVESFGARVFRRPVTDAEKKTYTDYFNQQKTAISFAAAAQLTVEALLQAPAFLYRVEVGDPARAAGGRLPLTSHEIASRLSYLIWGTMPDAALFDAAKANRLGTAAEIEAQARRMVADPKLRGTMVEFHRQWLEFDRLERDGTKDPTLYPTFTPALKNAIREESDRFVAEVMVNGDGSLRALLTSPTTFVNADLAKLYGVAAPASGWAAAMLKPAERAGILTRANFLASHAHAVSGSPPLRGVAIMRRVMCTTLPPPPGDADTTPPKPQPGDAPKTNRQLFEARTTGTCQGCHGIMDPLGFGLENYDAVGGYRTTDNGLPVDARGELKGIDVAGPFQGGIELSGRLADSAQVRLCVTAQWFSYGLGRDRTAADDCQIQTLERALAAAGGNIRELLVALTKTDDFMFRRAP